MAELIGGRFRVGQPIGSGAQGRVVAAHDDLLDRPVALKMLRVGGPDSNARARFLREARSAAGIVHPNVVMVYDVGAIDGDLADPTTTPYIAMELVAGPSLAQVVADRGPLDVADAVEATRQILAGLGAAHHRGLLHRDVKPGNVLLAPDGTVKLTDFGIATSAEGNVALTQTGTMLGTVAYLAPERIAGRPATPASDLYAVGVILYELLTGTPPFTGDTALDVAMAHGHAPVPDPRQARADVPPALAELVVRALAKDPADRFPSAAEMDRALADASAADTNPAEGTGAVAGPPVTAALPVPPAGPVISSRTATSRVMSATPADADPDDEVPARPGRPGRGPGLVRTATLIVGGILVAGVVAALVGSSLDSGGSTSAAPAAPSSAAPPPAAEQPAPTPSTPSPTPSTPEPTPPSSDAEPGGLDALIARLSSDPGAAGERGEDLVDRLEDVRNADPDDRVREATDTVARAARWARQDQLDDGVAREVAEVLVAEVGRDLLADPGRRDNDQDDD